ncbi:MAG: sulfite exporter TauE/SafE family protein [Cryomorphaceae bacterium]|jgi:uncharacterized membrane protein YfcA|nr:sulfite exporter TauE/SafE family protein [Cryomorphaceae bacterium]
MFWIIPLVAFLASILTFFSGFGLGTLLMAAMLWYYPPELAIALTALVHLLNSAVKSMMNRHVQWRIVWLFGIPSMIAAFFGARLLSMLSEQPVLLYDLTYSAFTNPVSFLSFLIGLFLMIFSIAEWGIKGKSVSAPLWIGGIISGFMGGLSGHQGALRSLFLLREIPDVRTLVSTLALIGLLTDVARNAVYLNALPWEKVDVFQLLVTGIAATLGVLVGTRMLKKVSIQFLQRLITLGIFALGSSMLLGLL